jgi:deoxycytidylate deaminase
LSSKTNPRGSPQAEQSRPNSSRPLLEYTASEIVFGLVYAVGTDYRSGLDCLSEQIRRFGYDPVEMRMSDYLANMAAARWKSEQERLTALMDIGDTLRGQSGRGDLVALAAIAKIAADRRRKTRSKTPKPLGKVAYILYSLKHEDEVAALRQVYGSGFYLIGFFSPESQRLHNLMHSLNVPKKEGLRLIERDQGEQADYGQQTRNTFELADFFVTSDNFRPELRRLLDLVFGHPYTTPNLDEYAMFLAYAASLRSCQLGRQVGAAIIDDSGDLISVGCNDVPTVGGGLYWPGGFDQRDHVLGSDSNDESRDAIIESIMAALKPRVGKARRLTEGRRLLKNSGLFDMTEYGRAVHAEMDALLACARSSTSPRNATLYTTTFPCHNCTRHIIAAGIRRVVYIEPYPKSKATKLHPDAIEVEKPPGPTGGKKIPFESFIGVGPRRFFQLFSVTLGGGYEIIRKKDGKAVEWDPLFSTPRVPILPMSYLQREQLASELFRDTILELESKRRDRRKKNGHR